jgi:hypothetical protein
MNGTSSPKLLPRITCPHCWAHFQPEDVLWVSEHVDLLGDPVLGPEQQRRFLPSRFTVEGDAVDARSMACRHLACPHCHLAVPRSMLELEPLFLSILGAPASGKSYFLTAMTWQLRKVLPLSFSVAFTDADPAANRILNECEEGLFLNGRESELVPLGNLIRKTELQGELYDTVSLGQQTINYPRPFLFSMQPTADHRQGEKGAALARMLCLYDNAGEHFQPGQDTTSSPVTRHLARSRAILFLFDPTQDKRFRAACRLSAAADSGPREVRLSRQETILTEAAARFRRHAGVSHNTRYDRPLIVVLSKFDAWRHLLGTADDGEPWKSAGGVSALDIDRIETQSASLRRIMLAHCPDVVTAADSFASDVIYVPVSALGDRVELDPASKLPGIRPANIEPHWVTVPILYALSRALPGLIPRLKRRNPNQDGSP